MVTKNLIKNIGKEDSESFLLVESLPEDTDDNQEILVEETVDQDEGSVSALETFINESLQKTLNANIKSEVKKALDDATSDGSSKINKDSEINYLNENHQLNRNNLTQELISILKSEIQFLRQELSTKDSIIKLLINDRNRPIDNKPKELFNYTTHLDENKNHSNISNRFNSLVNHTIKSKNAIEEKKISEDRNNLIHDSNCEVDINDDMHSNGKKKKQRSTTIIGDSILKDIEPRKMREAMRSTEKVFIKSFSGANTEAMEHYVKPTMKYEMIY